MSSPSYPQNPGIDIKVKDKQKGECKLGSGDASAARKDRHGAYFSLEEEGLCPPELSSAFVAFVDLEPLVSFALSADLEAEPSSASRRLRRACRCWTTVFLVLPVLFASI